MAFTLRNARRTERDGVEGPGLFTGGLVGRVVVLEAGALEHNLCTMAAWCAGAGVRLAPHGKTTVAPQVFA